MDVIVYERLLLTFIWCRCVPFSCVLKQTLYRITHNRSFMGRTSKTLALLLTLTIAMLCLILLTAKPANAQSTPNPTVPQFTIKITDHSYNIPPTYGIDQFTMNGEHLI